jgi:hypothetical protein
MRVKQNTENIPVPIRVYFKLTESCVPYDYLPRSKYHDLDHGCNLYFCPVYSSSNFRVNCIGVHDLKQCPDLNPGIDCGLTSNTRLKNSNSYRVYCLGALDLKQCLDLNPGLDSGLTSNTRL